MARTQAQDIVVAPSAAYGVATVNSPDIDTTGCSYLNVVVDTTAIGSSATVTTTISGKDTASGKYYTILASTAVATNTTTRMKVGPTVAASANAAAQDYLPKTIRITYTVATATSTFSIGASLTS